MANGETVRNFIFWGSRITADGDYNHEIKRCFLLGRKAMTNLDSILKSRDITLLTKLCLVKAMVFPVVRYGCESWFINEVTEDEMIGWHHRLDGHEFEQARGAGDGQGSLVCCSPWGRKELDTTERLNNSKTTPLLLILFL